MDASELKTTAELAQLELREEEIFRLQEAVDEMLANFEKMSEIDVSSLPPTTHALIQDNPLREDIPCSTIDKETLLRSAPERDKDFFIIPNVL